MNKSFATIFIIGSDVHVCLLYCVKYGFREKKRTAENSKKNQVKQIVRHNSIITRMRERESSAKRSSSKDICILKTVCRLPTGRLHRQLHRNCGSLQISEPLSKEMRSSPWQIDPLPPPQPPRKKCVLQDGPC